MPAGIGVQVAGEDARLTSACTRYNTPKAVPVSGGLDAAILHAGH